MTPRNFVDRSKQIARFGTSSFALCLQTQAELFTWYRWFTVPGTNTEEFVMSDHNFKNFAFPFVQESFSIMCLLTIIFVVKHINVHKVVSHI